MDTEFRCTLPSFHEYRTKDDDIITQSLEEQVNLDIFARTQPDMAVLILLAPTSEYS